MAFRLVLLALTLVTVVCVPVVEVKGDNYAVGLQIGTSMRDRITRYVQQERYLWTDLIPFYNTTRGHDIFEDFMRNSLSAFPEYMEELRGIAAGAQQPLYILGLLTFGNEISAVEGEPPQSLFKSCADVLVNGPRRLHGHNEDAEAAVNASAAIVRAHVVHDSGARWFVSYQYPGTLSGMSFAFNDHNLTLTSNALFPKAVDLHGVGRYFIERDLMSATSVDDVVQRVSAYRCITGFSFNVASLNTGEMLNVEIAPLAAPRVTRVPANAHTFHFNMYLHSPLVQQWNDTSSVYRLARARQMPAPTDPASVLAILGDTTVPKWPIYRNSTPPDDVSTVATALFDLDAARVDVFDTNPSSTRPWLSLSLVSGDVL